MADTDSCVHFSSTASAVIAHPCCVYSPPTASSPEALLAHYKQLCQSLQSQLQTAEDDIQDFTDSSKELQRELEQELERMESAERGLRREMETERGKADEWKVSRKVTAH
jgi:predicted  nucleic acid-binding Zn-ribbon protein